MPRSSSCVPSSASGWERYARPAAAPGRTGLHWASGGGAAASFLLYQGGLLSSQEREVGCVDSVGGPSFSICSKIRWFQGLCMCVFVCPCLYVQPMVNCKNCGALGPNLLAGNIRCGSQMLFEYLMEINSPSQVNK